MSVRNRLGYEMVAGEVEDVVWCGVEKRYDDHGVECFTFFVRKKLGFGHFQKRENVQIEKVWVDGQFGVVVNCLFDVE